MNHNFNLNAVGKKLAGAIDLFKTMTHSNPSPDAVVAFKLRMGLPNGSYFSTTEIAMNMQKDRYVRNA